MPEIDCDAWRAQYDTATVADQQAWHSRVWEANRDQSHYSLDPLAAAIARVDPRHVIELGGWDGEAACTMLRRFRSILGWVNVEICQEAVKHGRKHPRYCAVSPDYWYWENEWKADLFVGTHVIEHLRSEHLEAVIDATDVSAFYVEAPLEEGPAAWQGASALHILELGWSGVTQLFTRRGYMLETSVDVKTPPSSGGFSRCCLYRRVA